MTPTVLERAATYGRKCAMATHRNRDVAMAKRWKQYAQDLQRQFPNLTIVQEFEKAYEEEAKCYIGPLSM